ncbi:MAG TPA: FAD:protein FMN transferase [Armatimonadota bacterium]|jgi:thiamine biosynthesis lipoprotein
MGNRYLLLMGLAALLVGGGAESATPPRPPAKQLRSFEYTEVHMGGQARLVVYAPSQAVAEDACRAAYKRIADLEDVMSDYRPTSELMRLCAQSGGPPIHVMDDLFRVLQRAQRLAKLSNGAFDVTVGPYVALWREARKTGVLPSPEALASAAKFVGWRKVSLYPATHTVRLSVPGMRLDLGGIAKGYAGDEALKVLRRHGVTRAMYEAGGDIVVGDPPPGRKGWSIEVLSLRRGSKPRFTLLRNAAISTSGDTEQFVEVSGKHYSHVVDPHTGIGLVDRWAATVTGKLGMDTDSVSTALCVLGEPRAKELLRKLPGMSAFLRKATVR